MRVFGASLAEFSNKLFTNKLFEELEESYIKVVGRSVALGESNSWKASLPRLEHVIRHSKIPDNTWIVIEEKVPYFSKRIDVALFGHDVNGVQQAILIELKAWAEATALENGNVQTIIGGNFLYEPHPSEQVSGYHKHLLDFCRVFQGENPIIRLSSCAYCHNYVSSAPDEGLFHPQFNDVSTKSPMFASRDAEAMANFLHSKLAGGDGETVVNNFDTAGVGPSKQLIEYADAMIQRQNVFRLLDEQIVANNAIISAVKRATQKKRKHVILVQGGPGTGKSVIALNALGEILRKELSTYLVTGSAAFTHSMRRLLGKRLEGLVRFTDFFWKSPKDGVDVLIIDEAHRIRTRTEPIVPKAQRPTISQMEELLLAAKVVIFFADENQIISPKEVGEFYLFEETAKSLNAIFECFKLNSQFRCNGSSVYLNWLDDILGLTQEPRDLRLAIPQGFDFKILDTPQELLSEVHSHNSKEPNSARLIAGWCWPWSDPNHDGSLVKDIVIGDFKFPWEAKNDSKPAANIPEAKFWAIDPAGVNQAGCVYSVQGFEVKHIGVIMGPDLVIRNNKWVAQPRANYANELRAKKPDIALPYIKRIYRTLFSRGMNSCSVYFVDSETRQYFESKLIN